MQQFANGEMADLVARIFCQENQKSALKKDTKCVGFRPKMKRLLNEFIVLMISHLFASHFLLHLSEGLPDINAVSYTWKTKPWSSCFSKVKCGEGHRQRKVTCQDSFNFMVADSNCDESRKPPAVDQCFRVCDKHKSMLRWRIGVWSSCLPTVSMPTTTCIGTSIAGLAHRKVSCAFGSAQKTVDSSACEHFWDKPESEMACSLDCPQNCIVARRNMSCTSLNCPDSASVNREWREKAWESEAWRRKACVEAEKISANESRNNDLASLSDEKRQIGDLNTFFRPIETKIGHGSTINVNRPHAIFYLSKP
ncbi:Thrombospondin type-1 domain-containing protein 7B [Araneus ventricosus]|uniref:Thrombospondin type-1 domain-containing protein 7B n=1 Tax=Araneus ventricosus TaxID=182803 RepID=A0A4Y2RVA7_ARAVE|nr:Thrombospondin type-1 domain-containing protein 7B [Araneus ventricosus]